MLCAAFCDSDSGSIKFIINDSKDRLEIIMILQTRAIQIEAFQHNSIIKTIEMI